MRSPLVNRVQACCLALLLVAALPAAAQWTWRDAQGRITASDRPPPPEVPEKDILSRPRVVRAAPPTASAASAAAATAAPAGDRELEARKRAAEREREAGRDAKQRAEEQRIAEQRAENCRRARSQVAAIDSGQRMARVNEKGEREIMDDRARAEELRRAREVIAADCR
jgi:hypothetical protein